MMDAPEGLQNFEILILYRCFWQILLSCLLKIEILSYADLKCLWRGEGDVSSFITVEGVQGEIALNIYRSCHFYFQGC